MTTSKKYPDSSLVLLAGGKGKRMNSSQPKQYMEIGGKKVIEYSLGTLYPLFGEIVVIVPDTTEVDFLAKRFPGIKLAEAQGSRIDSLKHEIGKLHGKNVIVHDASRPFVTEGIVDEVITSLDSYKCAYPVIGLSSSVVIDKEGLLAESPDREAYREVQTPQGFDRKTLLAALEQKGAEHIHIPELIKRMGEEVKHTEGSPWLFKITFKPSIYAAEGYLSEHAGRTAAFYGNLPPFANNVKRRLTDAGVILAPDSHLQDISSLDELKPVNIFINYLEINEVLGLLEPTGNKDEILELIKNAEDKILPDGVLINVLYTNDRTAVRQHSEINAAVAMLEEIAKQQTGNYSIFTISAASSASNKDGDTFHDPAKIICLCSLHHLPELSAQTFWIN